MLGYRGACLSFFFLFCLVGRVVVIKNGLPVVGLDIFLQKFPFLVKLGLLPTRSGAAVSRPAFGRSGGLQLRPGPGSEVPAAAGRSGGGGHEISSAVHVGADLQATAGHAAGQVAFRRHLGHWTGAAGRRSLQGGRRRLGSRPAHRHLLPQVARIRLLGPLFRLLGTVHAGPGKKKNKQKYQRRRR